MILKLFGLENSINIDADKISVLTIEDPKLYYKTINEINDLINKKSIKNDVVLVEDDNQIVFSKRVHLLYDILNIDLNGKEVLNALYKYIQLDIDISKFEIDLASCVSSMYDKYIDELTDVNLPVVFDEIFSIASFLKFINFRIDDENIDNLLDRILQLIDIINELKLYELIIFVGLLDFLNHEEINELFKYIKYKKQSVLFIQRSSIGNIKDYTEFIIDEDYCESILVHKQK